MIGRRVGLSLPLALSLALASSLGCSASPADPDAGPPAKKVCECGERMEECDCPHCASMGEGFTPGACPCASRGYR